MHNFLWEISHLVIARDKVVAGDLTIVEPPTAPYLSTELDRTIIMLLSLGIPGIRRIIVFQAALETGCNFKLHACIQLDMTFSSTNRILKCDPWTSQTKLTMLKD